MSRSGYTEDDGVDQWELIRWRGAVTSSMRGKRGQAFLREMLVALDALPEKKLISGAVIDDNGCACALGAVALKRGMDVSEFKEIDEDDDYPFNKLGPMLGISRSMGCEIMYENDEGTHNETPEQRFARIRRWVERHLIEWDAP